MDDLTIRVVGKEPNGWTLTQIGIRSKIRNLLPLVVFCGHDWHFVRQLTASRTEAKRICGSLFVAVSEASLKALAKNVWIEQLYLAVYIKPEWRSSHADVCFSPA